MFRAVVAIFRFPFSILHLNDGDGLENSVDPDPLTPGNDAHGTNAEWYDLVCSDVFSKTEQPNSLPIPLPSGESVFFKPGVNTNAYYFVDVVAERGPAPIRFVADGASRLGNPVVVAQAGETNRVPLLIGATYSVMSDVSLRVFATVNDVLVSDENPSGTGCTVKWPLSAVFTRAPDNSFSFGLDGDMHARLNGSCSWGGACCLVTDGNSARYGCDGCGCGGCHAHVTYEYENYGIVFEESLGCGYGLEPSLTFEAGTNEVETASGADLSCYFDKRAVLFEEDYLDTPTNLVQGGSTTSCLFVVVHGGPLGGTLTLDTHNLEALSDCDGGPVFLNEEITVAPGRTYSRVVPCRGQHASGSMNDVRVEARFRENVSGCGLVKSTSTTAVEIDITCNRPAPDNASDHRHAFGIGETMYVRQTPAFPAVSLSANDAILDLTNGALSVKWGVADTEHDFSVSARGVTYRPGVSVVRPSGIKGVDAYSFPTEATNHIAGALYLMQKFVVLPTTVCFENIKVEEVPCYDVIEPTGYFTVLPTGVINRLSHTREAGAGKWLKVDIRNLTVEVTDHAGVGLVLPHITPEGVVTNDIDAAWMPGRKVWRIPFGWQDGSVPEGSLVDPIAVFCETQQIFTISANGDYKVEKLGHSSERKFDGRIFTDGTPDLFPSQTNQQEE